MNDHEIGMDTSATPQGMTNQCDHWKQVCSDMMAEVQELKAKLEGAHHALTDMTPLFKKLEADKAVLVLENDNLKAENDRLKEALSWAGVKDGV